METSLYRTNNPFREPSPPAKLFLLMDKATFFICLFLIRGLFFDCELGNLLKVFRCSKKQERLINFRQVYIWYWVWIELIHLMYM